MEARVGGFFTETLGALKIGFGGAKEASQSFQIIDGVRRAKAAEMIGQDLIEAQIQVGDKIVGTTRVNPAELFSPKTVIETQGGQQMSRWLSILNGTRAGESLPPITITPGGAGTPIPLVEFDFGGL